MGRGAYGGTLCGPVFQQFMTKATEKFGGGPFAVPPGGQFIKIDRFTGGRLPDSASGDYVVAEYFRDGEEPIFGLTYDGGFAMGSNLPLIEEAQQAGRRVTTSSGGTAVLGPKANFGTISSGGLY